MSEGQKKRNIGRGMKPRGNQQVKPQKGRKNVTTQSTTEGQGTTAGEEVLEGQGGNSKGGNLDPETAAAGLQNLESNGGEKGPEAASDDALEAALRESQNGPEEFPLRCTHGRSVDVPCDQCQAADMGNKGVDLETGMAVGSGTVKDLQAPLGGKSFPKVGPQPDGSEKFIITIQEGYTDAVRQWAEADGVPVEQWLSDRLYEYISTYGEPAKGR